MVIEVAGIRIGPTLRDRVTALMTEALDRWHATSAAAYATFFDDNGPKNAPAIRCALTIHAPHRRIVRVESTGASTRLAFDAAYNTLARQLHDERARLRDLRRRPKKYFVAKRLLAGTTAAVS